MVDHLGWQLQIREHLGHGIQRHLCLFTTRTVFFIQFNELRMQFTQFLEVRSNLFKIRSCGTFIFLFLFLFLGILTCLGGSIFNHICGFLGHRDRLFGCIGIDEVDHDFGQPLPAFLVKDISFQQDGMGVGKTRQRLMHLL